MGCGLDLGPRPLFPFASSLNVGEMLSLSTPGCPLHLCLWGIEVWVLSYPTPGQTCHANRPLQLEEEVTVRTCAYVQTCLNTLGPLHTFTPTNSAVHHGMFIPIFLFILFSWASFHFFNFTYYLYCKFLCFSAFPLDFCFGRDEVRCHLSLGGRKYHRYLRSLVCFMWSPVLRMHYLSWDDSPRYST